MHPHLEDQALFSWDPLTSISGWRPSFDRSTREALVIAGVLAWSGVGAATG